MNSLIAQTRGLLALALAGFATIAHAADPAPADVAAALKRSADWHLSNPSGIDTRDWVIAPLYDGLLRVATTTGDAKYLAAVLRFGETRAVLTTDHLRAFTEDPWTMGRIAANGTSGGSSASGAASRSARTAMKRPLRPGKFAEQNAFRSHSAKTPS